MNRRPCNILGEIAIIPLTQGQFAIIDKNDVEEVDQHTWYALYRKFNQSFYAVTKIHGKFVGLHSFVMNTPKDREVDHKNHNTLDNRKENLRIVTHAQNMQNKKGSLINSKTGIRGVNVHKQSSGLTYYQAQVQCDYKKYQKFYPYTPEGLKKAEEWILLKRLELFTHSDGR